MRVSPASCCLAPLWRGFSPAAGSNAERSARPQGWEPAAAEPLPGSGSGEGAAAGDGRSRTGAGWAEGTRWGGGGRGWACEGGRELCEV